MLESSVSIYRGCNLKVQECLTRVSCTVFVYKRFSREALLLSPFQIIINSN
nr:MAG TPA: hypothetical protein [Caudoviricetes sp.]